MDSPLLGTLPAGLSLSAPFSMTRGPCTSEYTSVTSPGPCPMCRLFRAGHALVHAELGSVALQIFTSQWMKTNGCSAINSNASRLKRCSWPDGGEWNWTVASLGQLIQHKKKQRQHRVFSFRLAALGPWSNISNMAAQRLSSGPLSAWKSIFRVWSQSNCRSCPSRWHLIREFAHLLEAPKALIGQI